MITEVFYRTFAEILLLLSLKWYNQLLCATIPPQDHLSDHAHALSLTRWIELSQQATWLLQHSRPQRAAGVDDGL